MCEPTEVHPSSEKLDSTQEVELSTGRNDKNAAHLDVVTDPPPQPQQNDKEQTRGSVEEAEELSTGRDDKVTAQSGEAVNPPCQPQTDENEEKMGSTEVTEELSSGRDDSDAAQLGEVINLPPQPQTGETEKKMGNAEETEELSTGRDDKDTAQLGEVINPPPQPQRDEKEEKMGSTEVAEELSTGRDDKDTKQLGEVINTSPQPQRDEKEEKVFCSTVLPDQDGYGDADGISTGRDVANLQQPPQEATNPPPQPHSSRTKTEEAQIESLASFKGNSLQMSDLTVYLKDVLGIGTHSKVFKGMFEDNIRVAVKRMSLPSDDSITEAMEDIKDIKELGIHYKLANHDYSNVVSYKCRRRLGTDLYIAIDLCHGTIDEYVKAKNKYPEFNDRRVLQEIAKGVESLHKAHIVHRDIKPSNFLMKENKILVSDYGQAKATHDHIFSVSGIRGTIGWMAPEVCNAESTEGNTACDIFQMGCVFYYVVTGRHPFEHDTKPKPNPLHSAFAIQNNINNGNKNINYPQSPDRHLNCLFNLIEKMLDPTPKNRPSAEEVVRHPALWDEERILNFFIHVSNILTIDQKAARESKESKERADKINKLLEDNDGTIVGPGKWIDRVPPGDAREAIISGKNASLVIKNNENKVYSVLRVIRNISAHWHQKLETLYGKMPEGYVRFWTDAFPDLLLFTYETLSQYKDDLKKFY